MSRSALGCAAAILSLSLSLSAQTGLTSPQGYLSKEGEQYSWMLGEYSDGRMMFFDGEMKGRVAVIKETAYRHDDRSHTASSTMGRTFSLVTLRISPCDYSKIDLNNFDKNPSASPSLVFSGSVTWPSVLGYPQTKPAGWDIKFPFSQSYIYTGQTDICLDYDFNGGKLANGRNWSTSWYQSYYLDGFNGGDNAQGSYVRIGTGCQDSGASQPAYCWIYSNLYSLAYTQDPKYQNHYRVETLTRHTAPSAMVVHALSGFGNSTGWNFPGVSCEKLFLDPSQPIFVTLAAADAQGTLRHEWGLMPYNKAFEGAKVYVQAAWDDSSTKATKLTYGEIGSLPSYPRPYKRAMIYQSDTTQKASTSTGKLYTDFRRNPLIRYGQ